MALMKGLTLDRFASLALPMDLVTLRGYLSIPATAQHTRQHANHFSPATQPNTTKTTKRRTDGVAELLSVSALVVGLDDDGLPARVPAREQDHDLAGLDAAVSRGARGG